MRAASFPENEAHARALDEGQGRSQVATEKLGSPRVDACEPPVAAVQVVAQDELAAVGDADTPAALRVLACVLEHAHHVQPARADQERARISAAPAMHLDLHDAIVPRPQAGSLIPVKGARRGCGPIAE